MRASKHLAMTKSCAALSICAAAGCYSGASPDGRELDSGATIADSESDHSPGDPSSAGDASSGDSPPDSSESGESDGASGDTSEPEPTETPLAEHIGITKIELNQGARITLLRDGAFVPVSTESGELIAGRSALVRALWTVEPGFSPRELEGRLLIRNGNAVETYTHARQVDGDADASSVQGGFLWKVPGDRLGTNSELAVEIRETTVAVQGPGVLSAARQPAAGYADLPMSSGTQRLDVIIVPLVYNSGGDLTVDLAQSDIDTIGQMFYDHHPIAEVSIGIRPPVDYPHSITTTEEFNDTLGFLVGLRDADQAPSNVYYAALVNIGCNVVGCGNAGTNGIGYTMPDEELTDGRLRVSTTLWTDALTSADVLVHELGHNHGLRHVPCPDTSPANIEPDYPYADGGIGGWGWAIFADTLHGSGDFDYMTYCDPAWVSDWTWRNTHARLQAVAALASDGRSGDTLLGHVHPNGRQTWFRIPSGHASRTPARGPAITFTADGHPLATTVATELPRLDGGGRVLRVEIPPMAAGFDAISWEHEGTLETTSEAEMRVPPPSSGPAQLTGRTTIRAR